MSNPIKEEIQRFSKRFFTYAKVILIGMSLSAVFLSLYAGIRGGYFSIQLLAVIMTTLSLALAVLFLYISTRVKSIEMKTFSSLEAQLKSEIPKREQNLDEELKRRIIAEVHQLSVEQIKAMSRRSSLPSIVENISLTIFFSVYTLAHLFYLSLSLVKFEFGLMKKRKEV